MYRRSIEELQDYVQQMRKLRAAELEDARHWHGLVNQARAAHMAPASIAYLQGHVRYFVDAAHKWHRQLREAQKQIGQLLADSTLTGVHRLMPPPRRMVG